METDPHHHDRTIPDATGTGIWSAPSHGYRLWYAVLAGIGLWMVHLTSLAALVNLTCDRPGVAVAMDAITVILALGTGLALWWSIALVRATAGTVDDDPGLLGRLRFMGAFGALTEAISLILIVWEGIYVHLLSACA